MDDFWPKENFTDSMGVHPMELSDELVNGFMSHESLAKTLYPDRFFRPFSKKIHGEIFRILDDDSIRQAVIAAPRGIGKNSLVNLVAPSRGILYRNKRYIIPISCSADTAVEHGENLKNAHNQLFMKELDYSDIESLGFIDNYDDGEGNAWYEIPKFGLICLSEYTDHNIEICNEDDETLFKGKIKNINELKLVLDMLGIEYTNRQNYHEKKIN